MDLRAELRQQLLAEHSKANTIRLMKLVGPDVERFAILWDVFETSEAPIPQRASWVLDHLVEAYPFLLQAHLEAAVEHYKQATLTWHERTLSRMLSHTEIPEAWMMPVFDIALARVRSASASIAGKVHSMTILYNIVQQVPELRNEVIAAIEHYADHGSAGLRSRAKRIMKALR